MTKKEFPIEKSEVMNIAEKGRRIYERIKGKYEPRYIGKYLAIGIQSKKAYLGATSADAMKDGLSKDPNEYFFLKKIGFDAAVSIGGSSHLNLN